MFGKKSGILVCPNAKCYTKYQSLRSGDLRKGVGGQFKLNGSPISVQVRNQDFTYGDGELETKSKIFVNEMNSVSDDAEQTDAYQAQWKRDTSAKEAPNRQSYGTLRAKLWTILLFFENSHFNDLDF